VRGLPKDVKEQGAGFLIAPSPNPHKVLRPEVPYNQFDGAFAPVGGSEPAYNLSTYLGTTYKNNRQVTLITAPTGPGVSDVWMSGYLDGACDIGPILGPPGHERAAPTNCHKGKISYLGGHQFATNTPLASGSGSMGTRLFLNALFEADCVTAEGQPDLGLDLTPAIVAARSFPVEAQLTATYANQAVGPALDATLAQIAPTGVTVVTADAGGTIAGTTATWSVGSISGVPVRAGDPPEAGARASTLRFETAGDYTFTLELTYEVGSSTLTKTQQFTIHVALDSDGDGVPDDTDPDPDDPNKCGDSDSDGCDDCSGGHFDPANDGCDPGNPNTGDGDTGCCSASGSPIAPFALGSLVLFVLFRRRRA
jgi:uncharacterized protein (TIGR03382 family)